MSKSQNKKNEQHCIKQNEKSFTQKDLSLTELWQKGELQSGWYWVELKEGTFVDGKKSIILDYLFEFTNDFERHPYLVEQVLAPVPSYEEYKKLLSEYEKECHRADELEDSYWKSEKENQKLKELLEECRNKWVCYKPYDRDQLLKRIDEVLEK